MVFCAAVLSTSRFLQGMSPEEAFKQSSESITGPITKGISKGGILKVYEGLDKAGQDEFKARNGTNIARHPSSCFFTCMYDGLGWVTRHEYIPPI